MAACGRRCAAGDALARRCNLERFLEAITPVFPTNNSSKSTMSGWRQSDLVDTLSFFALGDLWDAFRECSAYGTAVPVVLNGSGEGFMQYYVPYLSAIQLYGGLSHPFGDSRRTRGGSDSDYYHDTTSEETSDHEHETNPITDGFSVQEASLSSTEEVSSDDSESRNCHDQLVFEFLESEPPHLRQPLADKISALARIFPELKTLRSCDLSPDSWMSIAWYPIYQIPTGPTLRGLDTCFLTYHSLSTQFADFGHHNLYSPKVTNRQVHAVHVMCLPTFALASYKLKAAIWAPSWRDRQLVSSLLQAADGWLRRLRINHPDYRFFTTRRVFRR